MTSPWSSTVFVALGVAMGVLLVAMLVATRLGSRAGVWIAKPLASTMFLAAALSRGALDSTYGRWVLAGLALSWLGDVLLIPERASAFRAGLASFLLAHVAYGAAFVTLGIDARTGAAVLGALAVVAIGVGRWLLPHVRGAMRGPVLAYMTVITGMVALAAAATASSGRPILVVAAALFYVSDLTVARDKFVRRSLANRVIGLPLYYGAQLLFAATIG